MCHLRWCESQAVDGRQYQQDRRGNHEEGPNETLPCLGIPHAGFNGLEATVSLGPEIPISVSVALTGASYSFRKAISSDGLGVPNVYWTPSGAATLAINGDVLLTVRSGAAWDAHAGADLGQPACAGSAAKVACTQDAPVLRSCVHTGAMPVAPAQGDVSVELGLKGGAAITADAAISLLINTDPRSDGIGAGPIFLLLNTSFCAS